jgi:pimeloyl-ACP methyl ester carboxylesterase
MGAPATPGSRRCPDCAVAWEPDRTETLPETSATAQVFEHRADPRLPRPAELPVSVVFGAGDPYLDPDVARHLAGLFSGADLQLVARAGHWVQWDQPDAVASFEVLTATGGNPPERSARRRRG